MTRPREMTKSETRNPNQFRNPNDESPRVRISSFVIDSGFGFRASGFLLPLLLLGTTAFAQTPRPAAGAGLGQERIVVDDKTEQVIRGSLKWLASKQNSNGSWTANDGERQEVAMTGYVLITFLSCGHLPDEGEHG